MAAFTALALGLLAGSMLGKLGSGADDGTTRGTVGRVNPAAPVAGAAPPTPPPSTAQNAADAIPAAQSAADRVKKRAAAGDTLLTAAQTPTQTATPLLQPLTLLGK